jgi:hypothetical protein
MHALALEGRQRQECLDILRHLRRTGIEDVHWPERTTPRRAAGPSLSLQG